MAIGKVFKTGAVVLSAVGGTAGIVKTVVEVVEEYNIERQHIINYSDVYYINGVEYTEEEWNNFLTKTENESVSLYYGAVDSYESFSLTDLSQKDIISSTAEYTVTIDADDQYTLFAVPETFTISACKVSGFTIEIAELTTLDGYKVYSQPDKYETWLKVGSSFDYTLIIK